jgi:hypothetical protein
LQYGAKTFDISVHPPPCCRLGGGGWFQHRRFGCRPNPLLFFDMLRTLVGFTTRLPFAIRTQNAPLLLLVKRMPSQVSSLLQV